MLSHGSLFAGIGGFDLGFERAGIETLWQVEIEDYCRKVLEKNFPDAKRYTEIRECGAHNLTRVDIISGGFPCQDISNAGKRVGIEGDRSGLWSEMLRIVCELRPRYVVVENVAALLGRGMDRVLGDLAESGYDAEWDSLRASDFGAPHKRERIFIIAYPHEQRCTNGKHNRGSGFILQNENGNSAENKSKRHKWECGDGKNTSVDSPNNRSARVQRFWQGTIRIVPEFQRFQDVGRIEDLQGRSDIPTPLFRGSSDGIPNWMDRIRGLGNAVVPKIAEWIGRKILAPDSVGSRVSE